MPLAVARIIETERAVLVTVRSFGVDLRTKDPYLRRLPGPILELQLVLGGFRGRLQRAVPGWLLAGPIGELRKQLPNPDHLQLQGEELSSPFTPRHRRTHASAASRSSRAWAYALTLPPRRRPNRFPYLATRPPDACGARACR